MSFQDMSRKEIMEDYVSYDRMIREHIKKWPDKEMRFGLVENWGDFDEWFERLIIIVGGEKS